MPERLIYAERNNLFHPLTTNVPANQLASFYMMGTLIVKRLSPQEILVLIRLTTKRWKAESTLKSPSGFECGTPWKELEQPKTFTERLTLLLLLRDLTLAICKSRNLETLSKNPLLWCVFQTFGPYIFLSYQGYKWRYLPSSWIYSYQTNMCSKLLIKILYYCTECWAIN